MLVPGQDSTLRSFSTIHDKHNKSLGRASYNKKATKKSTLKNDQHKMPCVTDFATGIKSYVLSFESPCSDTCLLYATVLSDYKSYRMFSPVLEC